VSFNRALGNVQIASDFGIVAALQQQIDDLLFPGTHFVEFFFHCITPLESRPGRRKWRDRNPNESVISLFAQTSVHARSHIARSALSKCEIL